MTNKDRVTHALEHLLRGLKPFAEREFADRLGPDWPVKVATKVPKLKKSKTGIEWDNWGLLKAMEVCWAEVFFHSLGKVDRNFVGETLAWRNDHAHDKEWDEKKTLRALDTMEKLLGSVAATEQASAVEALRKELLKQSSVLTPFKGTPAVAPAQTSVEGTTTKSGLKAWREIATPHADVSAGRFIQAEFACNLDQVHKAEADSEYSDPEEFFRRTYLTSGLTDLLTDALRRFDGKGGEPVVELQTNFGGGKTHSMLALYHLFSGISPNKLLGVDALVEAAGVKFPPKANRAVLVGTSFPGAQTWKKDDGTTIQTLWGELAWQLGKKKGYAILAESDQKGVSPGSELLKKLFKDFGPALILVDEWVAYARLLYTKEPGPGGSMDSQLSFAQALTEAVESVPRTMLIVSLPQSERETGGTAGADALERLKNVVQRKGKTWRPATPEEGFEIVRRRLFEPLAPEQQNARDQVIDAFFKQYKTHANEFPDGCAETAYKKKMQAAYPIHPEFFDRLFKDWSELDLFQRTRGVLRFLARVVHELWMANDASLMVMPGSLPLSDNETRSEITRFLPEPAAWDPIIASDLDGEDSIANKLDREFANFGKLSASRRVARTLYLGTAPGARGEHPGIDDRQVRLGCVQPGDQLGVFGDALRRICDRARYVHHQDTRYWIATSPTLNRLAEERAADLARDPDNLYPEIERRLRALTKRQAQAAPSGPADVGDEPEVRLVVLGPRHGWRRTKPDEKPSEALAFAKQVLESRGTGPRVHQNSLVFLAPDARDLGMVLQAAAQFLAWQGIHENPAGLNLDDVRREQAATRHADADNTLDVRIESTWSHILVPRMAAPGEAITWDQEKRPAGEKVVELAMKRLKDDGHIYEALPGTLLRKGLDTAAWGGKDHVSLQDITGWFSRHLYLPRVQNADALSVGLRDGVSNVRWDKETFALADAFEGGRYVGLVAGKQPALINQQTLVVKPEVAQKQFQAEPPPAPGTVGERAAGPALTPAPSPVGPTVPRAPQPPKRFIASVELDNDRLIPQFTKLVNEVLQHLAVVKGVELNISLEVNARAGGGFDPHTVRTVSENAKTLKVGSQQFETE